MSKFQKQLNEKEEIATISEYKVTYFNTETYEIVTSYEPLKDEKMVTIDENIAYAISTLNKKGYRTKYCCEGHFEHDSEWVCALENVPNLEITSIEGAYICFEDGINLPSIPDGWTIEYDDTTWDDDDTEIKGYWEIIRAANVFGSEKESDFMRTKLKALTKLIDWVESLPDISVKNLK